MSSPRGLVVGGIDGIGTVDDDRLPNCVGEGDLVRFFQAIKDDETTKIFPEDPWDVIPDHRANFRPLRCRLRI